MTTYQFLKVLADTEGPLSVSDGILWFDDGTNVDLKKMLEENNRTLEVELTLCDLDFIGVDDLSENNKFINELCLLMEDKIGEKITGIMVESAEEIKRCMPDICPVDLKL
jgi:hypothetical protein